MFSPFTVVGAVCAVKVLAGEAAAVGTRGQVMVGPLLEVPQPLAVVTSTEARIMSQACFGTLLIRVPQSKRGTRLVSSPRRVQRAWCAPATDTTKQLMCQGAHSPSDKIYARRLQKPDGLSQ